MKEPRYLGDGVYIEFDGYQIKLTTSDGIHDTNTIYLEDQVLAAFLQYVKELKE
jgi:hypothetical protein